LASKRVISIESSPTTHPCGWRSSTVCSYYMQPFKDLRSRPWTHMKTPVEVEVNFIYLGNKEIYCISTTCYI